MAIVSSAQLMPKLLAGIQYQQGINDTLVKQMSSGKRVDAVADAPRLYQRSLSYSHIRAQTQVSLRSVDTGLGRTGMTMSVLQNAQNLMQRANVLAVQQASATVTAATRQSAAAEIATIHQTLLSLANTQWQGASLFAGTAIQQPAFQVNAAGQAVYQGNAAARLLSLGVNHQVVSNINGKDAFASSFAALEALQSALNVNDPVGIRAAMDTTKTAFSTLVSQNAQAGALDNALRLHQADLQNLETLTAAQQQKNDAADAASLAIRLSQTSVALQALFSQVGKLNQLTLSKYL